MARSKMVTGPGQFSKWQPRDTESKIRQSEKAVKRIMREREFALREADRMRIMASEARQLGFKAMKWAAQ